MQNYTNFYLFRKGFFWVVIFFLGFTNFVISQNEIGKAKVENVHQIILDASAPLSPMYHAQVDLSKFDNSAEKALSFFESRIKNNHLRFEIIGEKSILVIHLSNYPKSPKSVAEWNLYFSKKSSSLSK